MEKLKEETKNMIVIEVNEIPNSVFKWYSKNNKGPIYEAINNFGITNTILDDLPEEYLYPSQAWASISTGKPASSHKIRWYNDAKETDSFYWREASSKGKKVALMNVLHTGSISENEKLNYEFIFPDFFCLKPEVNIEKYKRFQVFNHNMSVSSGRQTSQRNLLINAITNFSKYPLPSAWGLSFKDLSKWISLIFSARKDSEVLRNAQFILQQRIFLNVINSDLGKDLSVFFTNHVASCLHRNFHDLDTDYELDKPKKKKIFQSMKILDEFLNEIKNNHSKREIILLSAMGQKLNIKVDDDYKKKNSKDYKLTNSNKFLEFFKVNKDKVKIMFEMIPQYTFKFLNMEELNKFINNLKEVGTDPSAMRFGYYVPQGEKKKSTVGFFCHIDINKDQVTCTMTVRPNKKGEITLNGKKINFEEMGFSVLNVKDFHHGEHSRVGCIISLNNKLGSKDKHFSEIKNLILSKI